MVVGAAQRRLAVVAEQASRGSSRVMYGSRAHVERARVPSVLELTPNCAQASLRKTARPVRCSWATYTTSPQPANTQWAAMVPADCGKRRWIAGNPLCLCTAAPPVLCSCTTPVSAAPFTNACSAITRRASSALGLDAWNMGCPEASRRTCAQIRPAGFFTPAGATPYEAVSRLRDGPSPS